MLKVQINRKNKMPENAQKAQENETTEVNQTEEAPQPALTAKEVLEVDYKSQIEELNDKVLRALAEAQNTRRRADIDIQNAKNFATQSFAKDLLGVMDNLFRASETISEEEADADPKLKNIKDGIEITKREMINVFERNNLKRIEPVGETFDPNLHQAISQISDANTAAGTILQVLQAGYILKERLIRPALVIVSRGAE